MYNYNWHPRPALRRIRDVLADFRTEAAARTSVGCQTIRTYGEPQGGAASEGAGSVQAELRRLREESRRLLVTTIFSGDVDGCETHLLIVYVAELEGKVASGSRAHRAKRSPSGMVRR